MKDWINEHKMEFKIHRYRPVLVGEIIKFPIIVQGITDKEVIDKLNKGLTGYFEAFPEEINKLEQ